MHKNKFPVKEELINERTLFSEGPVFTIVWEPSEDWPIRFVSKNISEILGYSQSEMKSDSFRYASLIHSEDIDRIKKEVIYNIENNINSFEQSYRLRRKDGEYRWFYDFTMFDKNEAGVLESIRGYMFDQTQLKITEAELIKAKEQAVAANIMKSQFLANMSHEIRTPMNGILGFLDLLERTNLSSGQKKYIKEAKSASEMLLYLINDILDFSKIEAGKLNIESTNFNLRDVVEEAVAFHMPKAEEKHIELYTKIKSNVPREVIGDPSRLRQVLNNLIGNAVKFTEYGEIKVNVELTKEFDNKAMILFEVKDTGIGVSEQALSRLFQPFIQADTSTTRKFGGTGLGLAISHELVKLMGGDISVNSEIGKGSNFKFTVLLEISRKSKGSMVSGKQSQVNLPSAQSGSASNAFDRMGKTSPQILLAEDNEINRKLLTSMLELSNIHFDTAVNGAEALSAIMQKEYDLIFMDCQMPEMDGYESTSKIREFEGRRKHTPIIAMTANAMEGDREKCLNYGMDDYLSKPLDFELVFKMIHQYAGKNQKPAATPMPFSNYVSQFIALTGFTHEVAQELFNDYAKYLPRLLERIKAAIGSSSFDALKTAAHQLKGSSGNLRIMPLHDLAMKLEEAAMKEEGTECVRLFNILESLSGSL